MAFPSIPQNFWLQQANGQVLLSWDAVAGAISYDVQRSIDNLTFSSVSSVTGLPQFLDTAVVIGTQYFYKISAVGVGGPSPFTPAQSCVPTPSGEMSLGELRVRSQQRADRLGSNFVDLPEWNFFIGQAMYELYDLLVTTSEDYFLAPPAKFLTSGATGVFPLPNGTQTFLTEAGSPFVAQPIYKLVGVDLGINQANNAWVTVNKFNFIDRNRFVYPNTASTIYGVFNMQYRMMGSNIDFIPTPTANQPIRLWYIPRLPTLLKDNDITSTGISGWLQYVIVRAAKYALDKEESDTSKLDQEITFLKTRIEESASNRDVGQPDKISDTRNSGGWGSGGGNGFNGPIGGF